MVKEIYKVWSWENKPRLLKAGLHSLQDARQWFERTGQFHHDIVQVWKLKEGDDFYLGIFVREKL